MPDHNSECGLSVLLSTSDGLRAHILVRYGIRDVYYDAAVYNI